MKQMSRRIGALLAAAVCMGSLVGCNTVEGGGWILSATGVGKATFGFWLRCEEPTVTGEMQYNDHEAGVKAHCIPTSSGLTIGGGSLCGGNSGNGLYFGNYTPQPPKDKDGNLRPGGRFRVDIHDGGEPGADSGDTFAIRFFGGVYDGYSNNRRLLGGNVQRVD